MADKKVWVSLPLSQESYTYDGAGRLAEDGAWVYGWNALGHLTSMTRKANTAPDPNVLSEVIANVRTRQPMALAMPIHLES